MSDSTAKHVSAPTAANTRVLSDAEKFVLAGHPDRWWYKGDVRSPSAGWPAVFEAANYHCVYCRKNVSASLEDIVSSTTDHVVPQLIFPEGGKHPHGPNHLNNLVPACSVCNSIKGSWHPPLDSKAWNSRKEFIQEARREIKRIKDERRKTYGKHLNRAKITIWKSPEHGDFL